MKVPKASTLIGLALVISAFFVPSFSCTAVAAPGDEHWDNQFGPVGPSDRSYALAVVDGKVYVGGWFTAVGNTKANDIAGYDGTNWFPLNNGVSGNSPIFSLATDGTNLYAGGEFTNADNSGATGLARWDGSNWSPLAGGNPNGPVICMKIAGTNFFVGGLFSTNGSVPVNDVARWDGSNWHALGAGMSGGTFAYVTAMEYDGTNLYAGGLFTQAGSVSATNIARWDGTSWSAMGNGLPGQVSALIKYGGYLYAGGTFTNASLGITNLAEWDGSSWSAVGTGGGANGTVRSFLSDGTNLYIGGDFTMINGTAANRIVEWDGGSNWIPLGAGVQGFGSGASPGVYSMGFDARGRLFVAGNFNQVSGIGASHVAGWDSTNWFALGGTTSKGMTHFLGQVRGLLADGTNLYAGGTFTEAGDVIVNGIARWNGTDWSALGNVVNGKLPAAGAQTLLAVGGYLFVGGNFTNIGGITAGRFAQWDGNNWSDVGDADAPVNALAFDGNFVWAGGAFTNIGGAHSPGLAIFWPNFGWYGTGPVIGGSQLVNALVVAGNYLYIGGNFTSIGGVNATNVARYNLSTSSWSPLGAGVNDTVSAIAVTNGTVYVGGSFTGAGSISANGIAEWDGSGWSALGSGLTSDNYITSVYAIVVNGNDVYAAGNFTNAGGVYAPGVAKWDGTSWSAMGSGLYFSALNEAGQGRALARVGNDIYVGGLFTFAGGKPSSFIARWNDQLDFYPPPDLQLTREMWLPGGQFQFRVGGTSGQSYIIQSSTNLMTWTPLMTNSATLYDFTDPSASGYPKRFYRAVLGP